MKKYVDEDQLSSLVKRLIDFSNGGTEAAYNMPPYLVVYPWKRTA